MAASEDFHFDPKDRASWYFGSISREETNMILNNERDLGVFLVRNSGKFVGDYVLCVKEDVKISHYIINKIVEDDVTKVRIGDQEFSDLPSLLEFYQKHYLDSTPLIKPALRERVIAKYNFSGNDQEDLPFKKGDVLEVISKDEKDWWTARNTEGKTGSIPVPYVQKYDAEFQAKLEEQKRLDEQRRQQTQPRPEYQEGGIMSVPHHVNGEKKLPALARVIKAKFPSPYDPKQLSLDVGDIVKVLKTNQTGEWEGEVNGKVGFFPFTHVQFLDNDDAAHGEPGD